MGCCWRNPFRTCRTRPAKAASAALLLLLTACGTASAEPATNPTTLLTAPATAPAAAPATALTTGPTTGPTTVPSSPEIERLLGEFLDPSWKRREKAQRRLTLLADEAEPRLRQFVATTDNAEARARAQTVLQQMTSARKMGPTLVTLHMKEAAPQAVFAELARRGNLPIVPQRENLWNRTSKDALTLDATDEPFWSVVRRACSALRIRPLFDGDDDQGRIVLTIDPTREMDNPVAFSGSFMVQLSSLTRNVFDVDDAADAGDNKANEQQRDKADKPDKPDAGKGAGGAGAAGAADAEPTTTLKVSLRFYADPKWRIVDHPDRAVIDSVTDDKGRELPAPAAMRMQSFKETSPIWTMNTNVRKVPAGCRKLGRIKGHFKIVLLEESGPLEVENVLTARNVLKKVDGQTVQVRETVREGEVYRVKVTIFRNGLSTQDYRQQREEQGITLLDDKGRPFPRGGYNAEENGDQVDYDLTFLASDAANARFSAPNGAPAAGGAAAKPAPVPARLVIQLPLEPREATVPFELKDLPVEK